jgi:hypothetical protein
MPVVDHNQEDEKMQFGLAMKIPILLLVFRCALPSSAAEPDASFLNNGVTAHRGNSGDYPENTLPAFESGIEVGADWIELDIFRTKDGKLVVIHDKTTARTGDM